jgi:hypothetical protein
MPCPPNEQLARPKHGLTRASGRPDPVTYHAGPNDVGHRPAHIPRANFFMIRSGIYKGEFIREQRQQRTRRAVPREVTAVVPVPVGRASSYAERVRLIFLGREVLPLPCLGSGFDDGSFYAERVCVCLYFLAEMLCRCAPE